MFILSHQTMPGLAFRLRYHPDIVWTLPLGHASILIKSDGCSTPMEFLSCHIPGSSMYISPRGHLFHRSIVRDLFKRGRLTISCVTISHIDNYGIAPFIFTRMLLYTRENWIRFEHIDAFYYRRIVRGGVMYPPL